MCVEAVSVDPNLLVESRAPCPAGRDARPSTV